MRKCWYDDVVDHDGERFHYEGLKVRPQPQAPRRLARRHRPVGAASAVGRLADGWLPSFVTPADAAAGRAVIEQVAAEHEREIEDDHYGVLIPYTMEQPSRRPAGRSWPSAAPTSRTRRRSCPVGWDAVIDTVKRFVDVGTTKFVGPADRRADARTGTTHLAAAAEALLPLET